MAQKKKNVKVLIIFLLFLGYFITAARSIPNETVISFSWINSLQKNTLQETENLTDGENDNLYSGKLVSFSLGDQFGFVDQNGKLAVNNIKNNEICLGMNLWTQYDRQPSEIEFFNTDSDSALSIKNPGGYPMLLDNRIFILGREQNILSEYDASGNILWVYEFGAPLTCIDAASGLILTGSVDGVVEILDVNGRRVFYFEPGGSRYSIILGCAFSRNGSRAGIICGIDQQRFLMLEQIVNTNDYKVVYHEFLDTGFRRPVQILFISDDKRIIFECHEGLGCYDITARRFYKIKVEGDIIAMDDNGDQDFVFLINNSPHNQKELIGIKFPQIKWRNIFNVNDYYNDAVFMKAPFNSNDVFLRRNGSTLIVGGGETLISFNIESR